MQVTIELEAGTARYVADLSKETGTPVSEIVAAIVNGHAGNW